MHTSPDILFKLIQSMSQTEKRYFKCFSKQYLVGKKDRYVKLFDLINSQSEYDETKLLKSIREPQFKKDIVKHKQYLYHQILKALRNYESTRSVYLQLEEALINIEILFKKKIYDGALTLVNQSLKTAIKYEFLFIQIELKKYQRYIQLKTNGYKYCEYYLDDLWEEEHKFFNEVANINTQIAKQVNLFYKFNSNYLERCPIIQQDITHLEESSMNNFYTTYLYYQGEVLKGRVAGNIQHMYTNVKTLFRIFDNKEYFIDRHLNEYIACGSNYINVCEKSNRLEEGKKITELISRKLEHLNKKHTITTEKYLDCKGIIQAEGFFLNLQLRSARELKECCSFINGNQLIHKNQENPKVYMFLLYVVGLAEFLFESIDVAIERADQFNLYKKEDKALDIDGSMRLLSILMNYEKGNLADLPTLIDSTYLFLASKGMLQSFEKLLLNFFKTELLAAGDLNEKWHSFNHKIKSLDKETLNTLILRNYAFKIWIESKIEGCSMRALLER